MFHIADLFEPVSPIVHRFAMQGHFGVPLFFAISGYCMFASAESTNAKRDLASSFLIRRLIRIMPPFWLSILVVLAVPFIVALISLAKSGHYEWPHTDWMIFSALDWLQLATLTRPFFHSGVPPHETFSPVNAVYWTLAIELQFYLVMAAAVWFKDRWKRVVLAVLGVSLITYVWPFAGEALFLAYWPAFALGMALRLAHVRGITPAAVFKGRELLLSTVGASAVLALGLAVALLPSLQFRVYSPAGHPVFALVALASIVFLWLMGGVEHGLRRAQLAESCARAGRRSLLPLLWVGQSSYSLYLLHGKLFQIPAMVARQVVSERTLVYPLLTMAGTAILCHIFYLYAERPFQSRGGTKDKRLKPLSGVGSAVSASPARQRAASQASEL